MMLPIVIFGIIAFIAGIGTLAYYHSETRLPKPKQRSEKPSKSTITDTPATSLLREHKGIEVHGIIGGESILDRNPVPDIPQVKTDPQEVSRHEIASLFVPTEEGIYHQASQISERGWSDLDYVLIQLSRLPTDAAALLEILNNPDSSAADVAAVCEDSVGLTARILKLVNSPFYGLSSPVDEIKWAVSLLGFNEIRQIVITSSIFENSATTDGPVEIDALWKHSLTTARISSWIADRSGIEIRRSFCGTAAMLHDVGKLVLQRWRPAGFTKAVGASREKETGLMHEEIRELGITHALAGVLLLHCWHLPQSLSWVVKDCHIPLVIPQVPESAVVHLAGQVARYMGIGSDCERCDETIQPDIRDILNLDLDNLRDLVAEGFEDFVKNTLMDLKVLVKS